MNTTRGLTLAFASFPFLAVGCSKSEPKASSDDKAKTSESSTKPKAEKGSSASTAKAAKSEKQKSGGKAEANQSKAESQGDEYEGIACDEETEDLGFCGDDSHIIFRSEGAWYSLDCGEVVDGAFRGEEEDIVDCYVEVDDEDDVDDEEDDIVVEDL